MDFVMLNICWFQSGKRQWNQTPLTVIVFKTQIAMQPKEKKNICIRQIAKQPPLLTHPTRSLPPVSVPSCRDLVHRQTASAVVQHMSLGVYGFGCEDSLNHLLNYVWPNVFETSPHVIQAVMGALEGLRVAIGPCRMLQYCLQVTTPGSMCSVFCNAPVNFTLRSSF